MFFEAQRLFLGDARQTKSKSQDPCCGVMLVILKSMPCSRVRNQMLLCGGCKSYSPATASTCITCDAVLSASTMTTQQVDRHQAAKRVMNATQVMICKNCTRNNPKSSRFCNWCGFKAPIPTQQVIVCVECEYQIA